MGNEASQEETEVKMVDTNGNVNNNIIIQQKEAKDVHTQMLISEKLYWANCILIMFEVWKVGVYIFHSVKKSWKRNQEIINRNNSRQEP